MNSSLLWNEYSDSKCFYIGGWSWDAQIKGFVGDFFYVTKIVPSALWTDQFYFTQMKAVNLGVSMFWKSEESFGEAILLLFL